MIKSALCIAAISGALLTSACGTDSTGSEGMGTVRIQLTDAPFPFDSVDKVEIHVLRVDARLQEADSAAADANVSENSGGGWLVLASPDKVFDLLKLRGGALADLGSAQLAAGTYRGLRLVIDASKSSLTLKNGITLTGTSSPGVKFPSASTSGLKINFDAGVDVDPQSTTVVVIDFDVGESFVMRGNSITQNGLLFKPTLSASVK